MMKPIVFLLLFLPTICLAQMDWAPVGAKWWYEWTLYSPVSSSYSISFYNMEAVGEVEVQGRVCKELSWGEHGQDCFVCDSRPYYIYSDSGKVYYFNHDDEAFSLLYDMNKGIGESWEVRFNEYSPNNETILSMTVIDTMSLWVNGVRLRQQRVDYHSQYGFGDIITEGLGSTNAFFPNCAYGGHCEAGYGALRCYEDSLLGMYHATSDNCEYQYTYVSVEEYDETDVKLWPNPANSFVNVETDGRQDMSVQLYDLAGRDVLSSTLQSSKQTINIGHLPAGIYMAVLSQKGVAMARRKLVVE